MNPMSSIAGAGLAFAATFVAVPSFAVPTIHVTASEVISTVPPRYKTTFTVQRLGYDPPAAYFGFHVTSSGQGAPVTFYDTEDPGYPWSSQNTAALAAYYVDGGGIQGLLQFSVTTDQQNPCVTITFLDGLLSKAPTRQVQSNYVINGCLALDMPTPVSPSSWGGIKAIYR